MACTLPRTNQRHLLSQHAHSVLAPGSATKQTSIATISPLTRGVCESAGNQSQPHSLARNSVSTTFSYRPCNLGRQKRPRQSMSLNVIPNGPLAKLAAAQSVQTLPPAARHKGRTVCRPVCMQPQDGCRVQLGTMPSGYPRHQKFIL